MATKQPQQQKPEAPEVAKKKELEQRYLALKILDQQIKQTQKKFMLLEQQAQELESTKEALDELCHVTPGTEILVPVANGVFAKATINDCQKLIVNVGANTSVTKPVADVKKIIDEQSVEIRKAEEEVSQQLQTLASQAQTIEQDMSSLL